MRETKFRAWDGRDKKYIYWTLGDSNNFWDKINSDLNKGKDARYEQPEQYTGLKDKNGKEIYEGDIIHLEKDGMAKPPFLWDNVNKEVAFENGMFMVGGRTVYQSSTLYQYKFEVIGNIYENPELIK